MKEIYLNFPVSFLSGAFTDIEDTCSKIIKYAIYSKFLTLKEGTEKERIELAGSYLCITIPYWKSSIKNGAELYDQAKNQPMTGVKQDIVFDFRDNYKTEFEIAVFTAFCAFKSIIGSNAYVKTGNDYLLARMAGNASIDRNKPIVSEKLQKYAHRWQLDKIKFELRNNWNLKYYSNHTRGFYASFTLDLENLILQAEKKRKKYQAKQLNVRQNEAYKNAMERLKEPPTLEQHINNTLTTAI